MHGMRSTQTSDLFVAAALRMIVLSLIFIASAASVLLAYQSLIQLIAGNIAMLAAKIFWSIALAAAAAMLIRHRGEIVDD